MSQRKIAVTPSRPLVRRAPPLALLLATTALTSPLLIATAQAQNVPTGASVAAGSVTITQPSATQLNVTQSSQSAVVNYQSFSVGQGSGVTFAQPNASSAILNRVTGNTSSNIAGSITANGQVYLVNPNGIAITRSGTVNAGGGFVASTLGISDADFMAGKRTFTGNGASARVSNAGTITVGRGGYAALIGGTVSNSGSIDVPLGKVGLGSGEQATLDFSGDGFLQVAVPTNATSKSALIRNSGTINADGGSVIISAATAREAARNAINISGTVQARSISGRNGSITIGGGDGGKVKITGRIDAVSRVGSGGTIAVTGRNIKLKGAVVDASGKTGGGTINIGGGRQGTGPLQRAQRVTIDAATTIKADAIATGNGGNVTVWSDGTTLVYGAISARGGAQGGDGGQIETSGHTLNYAGIRIDASAVKGQAGNWLLDPTDLIVDSAAATSINATLGGGTSVTLQTFASGAPSGPGTTANGNGDIIVNAGLSWSTSALLTLTAHNAIAINAPINVTGPGGVALNYNTASPTNLTFNNGASIDYGASNQGGTLAVNGQNYALVYSMADLAAISSSGRSALATHLFATSDGTANGTPTVYTGAVVAALTGTFEALGNTVSNLTINTSANAAVGLFGTVTGGTVRDIGLVGGTVTGSGSNNSNIGGVGALVGMLTTVSNGTQASVVNAFATTTVSGGDSSSMVGGLVGEAVSNGAPTLIANSYATGSVTGGLYANVGGLAGQNFAIASSATISGSYATGAVSTGGNGYAGGLTAYNYAFSDNATITNSHATGAVSGGVNAQLGGLVGNNYARLGTTASISNVYATGAVGASNASYAGGLVGGNSSFEASATISNAYATGAVSGFIVGGLVGLNSAGANNGQATASISNSYATGAVSGVLYGQTGGLVGLLQTGNGSATASVTNAYSTGRVTGVSGYFTYIGGSIGWARQAGGPITVGNVYWDTATSGQSTGIGVDNAGQQANVVGYTTRQLQGLDPLSGNTYFSTVAQLGNNATSAFSGGAGGLYPYLTSIFPGGVQVVSGTTYMDGGSTPAGGVTVDVVAGGSPFASVTSGINGYYYAFGAAGLLSNGRSLLATGSQINSAALSTATGATLTNVPLYGSLLSAPTSQATLSAAIPDAQANAVAAAGGNARAISAIQGATTYDLVSSAASFTIDQPVSTSSRFAIQTTATNAPITVAAPIDIFSTGSLTLNAAGALAFNAPVQVLGSAPVVLSYNAADPANLSFAIGAPLNFYAGSNGSLTINGNAYTLISDVDGLQNINSSDLGGHYALAGRIDASATASWNGGAGFIPLGTNGAAVLDNTNLLNSANGFAGTFNGLGNTIDQLTMNRPGTGYVGLFGKTWSGAVVQNVGLTNASINGQLYVGGLVGRNSGTVTQSYVTGQVQSGSTTDAMAGGLVGYNEIGARLAQSFATAAVSGPLAGEVGGAVGFNRGLVDRVYATGSVTGFQSVGGLVGFNQSISGPTSGMIVDSYATGAVNGTGAYAAAGSFVGYNTSARLVSGYYDAETGVAHNGTNPTIGGIGADFGGNTNVIGLSTSSLQNGGAFSNGLSASYGGGTGGLYPYLNSFYPNGAQALSGTAYTNAGTTALAGGQVTVFGNNLRLGSVSTGANGYYYVLSPAGTLPASAPVLAFTSANVATGATNAATLTAATGATAQTGVNIYGNTLAGTVADTTLSTANSSLVAAAGNAVNQDGTALIAINGAAGRYFIATGAGFDIDQQVATTGLFGVRTTTSGAGISVSQPITVNGTDSLWLQSAGALAINAPVTVAGAGNVVLATSTSLTPSNQTLNELSFAMGAAIDYGATNNGGTLSINGTPYTLLYNMGDVSSVNTNLNASYALATNIDASASIATPYTSAVIGGGAFSGTLDGLGHTIANLTISAPGPSSVGLVGWLSASGAVRNIGLVGGRISGDNNIGGLVGLSNGVIERAYSSASVVATDSVAGGLVGYADSTSTIRQSFATGAVSADRSFVGGLVGVNFGRISDSYATGSAVGALGVGGLVGYNPGGVISRTFATGYVTGGTYIGGLVGYSLAGSINQSYWDRDTSGRNNGIGLDSNGQSGNVTGLTTGELQGTANGNTAFPILTNLGDGTTTNFGGGFDGNYPFLRSFFPSGPQVVSGTIYGDGGLNAAAGAAVGVNIAGTTLGIATAGANGYYYAFGAPAGYSTPQTLLAYRVRAPGATLTTFNGSIIQSGVNLYGGALTTETYATSLTGAPTFASLQTDALAAAGSNVVAQAAVNTAGGLGLISSGASFNIDQAIGSGNNTFYLQMTSPTAPITVSAPITLASGGGLGLLSTGALTINAPITINGAGTANLAYDASNPTNLNFAQGAPLTFVDAVGSPATSAVPGQSLTINGQNYSLLYNMGDVAAVNNNIVGRYALANSLDAGASVFDRAVIAGNNVSFAGVLEGLGHTISNLTINASSNQGVGLIGFLTGTVRDIGITGGSIAGQGYVGALVGYNVNGLVVNAYATSAVSGGTAISNLGGLVGYNDGTLINVYATGSVSSGDAVTGLGGLVGINGVTGVVTNAFATGAVSGGGGAYGLGGLAGANYGTITNVYATGAVSAGVYASNLGGLVGDNHSVVTNGYWDRETSGQMTDGGGAIGLTTRQLQGLDYTYPFYAPNNLSNAFSGGGGLYPYLSSFFPNGVQVVSGTVYRDAGATPLGSGVNGAVSVGVVGNGVSLGTASAGANGYYYVFGPAGTLSTLTNQMVAFTNANPATGAKNAATLSNALSTIQSGVNIYGDALTVTTAANYLSLAPSLSDAQALATPAAGGNANALAAINGTLGRGFISTGDFTIDRDVNTANTFFAQTTALGAAILVSNPITLTSGGSLGLVSADALTVNAPITAMGAASVNLAYDQNFNSFTPSATHLSFAQSAPLTFTDVNGAPLTSSAGGSLAINGSPYTLLYNISDVVSANGNLAGNYALATNIDAGGTTYTSALIGGQNFFSGTLEGLGHTVANVEINSADNNVGFVGESRGIVRNIGLIGGSVKATNLIFNNNTVSRVGMLVGFNNAGPEGIGTVANAYATGSVTGNNSGFAGGLVGLNFGNLLNSYATGAVGGSAFQAGGLTGRASGTVTNVYATGAVSSSNPDSLGVGGLAGSGGGSITNAYATGAVSSAGAYTGGLIGRNLGGYVTAGYYDINTTGQTTDAMGAAGLTTRQLQGLDPSFSVVSNLGDGTTSAFAGGANGLYPYLSSFFPNGVQVVSGTAYSDAVGTPLASGANGAVTVNVGGGGVTLGSVSTGANGYYYAFGQPGTIADGAALLAYMNANYAAGVKNSLTLATANGTPVNVTSTLQTGVDLYNGALAATTSELTLSAAASALIAPLDAAVNQNPAAVPALVGAYAGGRYYIATGASFTIDTPVVTPNIFGVSTVTGAPLTVSRPITINDGGSLGLFSGGSLAVNAPINVNGAGSVGLAYDASSPTTLTFALGSGLTFANADGSPATTTVNGQSLAINGQGYTLLYSMVDLDAIDGHNGVNDSAATAPIGPGGTGMTGRYALASNFDAASVTYIASPIRYDVNTGTLFSGVLEGLGHTISNLTVNDQSSSSFYTGLIGQADPSAVVRDIGLVGSSITGQQYVGGLVGSNYGLIANAYSTAAVTGTATVGGLVGYNQPSGILTNVWTAGTVTGSASPTGGLVGLNGGGRITDAVSASYVKGSFRVGGLIGWNNGTLTNVVATGAVVGGAHVGGLVGFNDSNGVISQGYFDTATTGQTAGIGFDFTQAGNVAGLATMQLQSSAVSSNLGAAFGGADGLYPYLASFFPSGVQAVSGFAYQDGGVTPLASGGSGAAYVSVASNGQTLQSVTTGANGYYYAFVPMGTLNNGAGVAAYTQANVNTGAADAVSYQSGTPDIVTRLDISGGWRRDTTLLSSLTALDAGFATTTTGTPVSGFTLPNRDIFAIRDFTLNSALSVTGTLSLASVGSVTQTAALSAGTLLLEGRGFILTNIGNQFGRLAASGEEIDVFSATSLTIAANVSTACGCIVTGVSNGSVRIATAGDLTIESGAAVTGDNPILAAAGAFINNAGANAVVATSGRWLVYAANSTGNTFGGLDSGNTAVWGTAAGAPVVPGGDRYVFAANRTLTVTTSSDSKTYGEDITGRVATDYTITGFDPGIAGAYLADTASTAFSGAANVTSGGARATANVVGSPYAITASLGSLTSDSGYGFAIVNAGTLNVNRRAISVTADTQSRIYGNSNPALTYSVGGLGLVNGDTLSGALATVANATSNVGSYGITQGTLAASANYNLTYANANLGVTQRTLNISADAQSRIYGNANPALTYTVGGLGLVNGDTLAGGLATSATTASNVGSYAINQGTLAASANYALTYTGANLAVAQRALSVTADAQSRIYGNSNPALTYAIGGLGLVNGDTLTGSLATSGTTTSNVGSYAINQGTLAASSNYALTYSGANLGVTPRALSVTADAQSRIYGNANPALTYAIGGPGLVNGDALTGLLATSANTASNVGSYAITLGTLANANYAIAYTGANLAVTPRALSVTADALSRVYGNANPALTYATGGLGLVNGDTLSGGLATSANTASNIGSYAITQGTLANANYAITYTGANLAVTPRALSVAADALSRIYGNANPVLTYTTGGLGLVNGDTMTGGLATSTNAASNVGSYAITQGSLAASSNYTLTYAGANLAVTPRALSVTADAQSRIYNNANPALTYTIGGLGLVNGETLTGGLATDATTNSNIGSYPITQGNLAASSNYSLAFTGALLTVRPTIVASLSADLLASSVVRDNVDWIALPEGATPLPGVAPIATSFGTGVFYSDPRFDGVLVCFGNGIGAAASCFAAGR